MEELKIPSVVNSMDFLTLSNKIYKIDSKNKSYSEIFESVQNSNDVEIYKKNFRRNLELE